MFLQYYRLYYVWFTIGWIAGIYVYFQGAALAGALAVKATLYILLYFTSIFEVRKYWYYFQNSGRSTTMLYVYCCLADFLAYCIIMSCVNLILYAGN